MNKSNALPTRFRVYSTLGKGGFGTVVKAYDASLEKIVAVKILSNISKASQSSLKREFETLSQLNHPHLVKVYDFGFLSSDVPYFTMEFIDGEDLLSFFASHDNLKHLPLIIEQTLQALSYLNEKQIIHSDIKPENIFVFRAQNGAIETKILDFGLASALQCKSRVTSGTPRFVAPEVLMQNDYSPASDLYSLGMTLIESIIGQQVPSAFEVDGSFIRRSQEILADLFSLHKIPNPLSIASFILDLLHADANERPRSSLVALQSFRVILDVTANYITPTLKDVFINREDELNTVDHFLNLADGNKHLLILEGNRGLGKKQLIYRAIASAQLKGCLVIDLSSDRYTHDFFSRFIDTLSNNLTAEQKQKFLSQHGRIMQMIEAKSDIDKDKQHNARVAFSNIFHYLQEVSRERPILICIPDIERFSEDFFLFIDQLLHEVRLQQPAIRFIISRNADLFLSKKRADILKNILDITTSSCLAVRPFNSDLVVTLQTELFGRTLFSDKELRALISETEGIPLLVVEFIKHLVTRNIIKFENGLWHLDRSALGETAIPKSIYALIEEEYITLPREEKTLAQIVALWGRPILYEELHGLCGFEHRMLESTLVKLETKLVLKQTGENEYYFVHPAYSRFVREKTSKSKAVKIAQIIVSLVEKTDKKNYERLALHCIEARLVEKACKYGLLAADILDKRLELYRCHELLEKLESLVAKNGTREQQLLILEKLAPIEQRAGYIDKAYTHYDQLLNNAKSDTERALHMRALARIHSHYWGEQKRAAALYRDALKHATPDGNPNIIAEILIDMTAVEPENTIELLQRAAQLTRGTNYNLYSKATASLLRAYTHSGATENVDALKEELNDLLGVVGPVYKSFALHCLSIAEFFAGKYDNARKYAEEEIMTDIELCDEVGLGSSYNNLGGIHYVQGNFYDQINILRKAINQQLKYSRYHAAYNLGNISLVYRCVADYREGLRAIERAFDLYENFMTATLGEFVLLKSTSLYLMLGEKLKDKYMEHMKKTEAAAKRHNNMIVIAHTQLLKARYYYQRLAMGQAIRHAREAIRIFDRAADKDDLVDSRTQMGIIFLERGDIREAESYLSQARNIYNDIHCEYLNPQLLYAEGVQARVIKLATAKEKLLAALKTSKKMFTREYTWQIQRELALYHKEKGELHKALQYYRDAIDMIKEITETIDGDEVKASYLALPFRKRVFDEIKILKQQLN